MQSLLNSKKGNKVVITIFALLLLVLIFVVFIFLFRTSAYNKSGKIEHPASSLSTELLLKNFLRTPVPETGAFPVKDLTPYVGEVVTNADLVGWTCTNDENTKNYILLKESINNFFDGVYDDDWNIWILYSNPDLDKKGFGHKNLLDKVNKGIKRFFSAGQLAIFAGKKGGISARVLAFKLFTTPYREAGYASQIIPCLDGSAAQIALSSTTAFFEVKHLKNMGVK